MKKRTLNLLITLVWTLLSFSGSFSAENTGSNHSEIVSLRASGSSQDSVVISSLQAAEKLAFQANTDIANGRLDIESLQQKRNELSSSLFPQISAKGSATGSITGPWSMIPPGYFSVFSSLLGSSSAMSSLASSGKILAVNMNIPYNSDGSLLATQKLFDPAYLIDLKSAKSSIELSKLDLAKIRESVALQVASIYYNLLLSSRQIAFLRKQLASYEELYSVAQVRFQAGVAKKSEPDQIKVDQTNIETELENFEKLYQQQISDLQLLIGLPSGKQLTVCDSIGAATEPISDTGTSDLSSRPDWLILRKQEDLQDLAIRRQKAEYLPVLAAKGTISEDFYSLKFDPTSEPWYNSSAVAITLDFPLFDGFGKRARIAQSRIALTELQNRRMLLETQIGKEIHDAQNSLIYSIARLKGQDANHDLAQEVYRETEVEYQGGTATISDLLTAENSLIESQRQYMTALADKLLAELSLNKAKGTLLSSLQLE